MQWIRATEFSVLYRTVISSVCPSRLRDYFERGDRKIVRARVIGGLL